MNFSFMLTIILLILVHIKLNIKNIPNYMFSVFILIMLFIGELYNYKESKEQFIPVKHDTLFDKYVSNDTFLHKIENNLDKVGMQCKINKNKNIKEIQDKTYNTFDLISKELDKMEEMEIPSDSSDITNFLLNIKTKKNTDIENIENIKNRVCPEVCGLLKTETECDNSIDINSELENMDELYSTKQVFYGDMEKKRKECRDATNTQCDNIEDCTVNNNNKCRYNKKKCLWDSSITDQPKCINTCNYYNTKYKCEQVNSCDNPDICKWSTQQKKCNNA